MEKNKELSNYLESLKPGDIIYCNRGSVHGEHIFIDKIKTITKKRKDIKTESGKAFRCSGSEITSDRYYTNRTYIILPEDAKIIKEFIDNRNKVFQTMQKRKEEIENDIKIFRSASRYNEDNDSTINDLLDKYILMED